MAINTEEQRKARGLTLNQSVLNAVNKQLPGGPADRPPLGQLRQQATTGREGQGLSRGPRQTLDNAVSAVTQRFMPSTIQPSATPKTQQSNAAPGLSQNAFNVPGNYNAQVAQLGVPGADSSNMEIRGPSTMRPGAPMPTATLLGQAGGLQQLSVAPQPQQLSAVPTSENFSMANRQGVSGRTPQMQAAINNQVAYLDRQTEAIKRARDPYVQATGFTADELRAQQQQRWLEQRALGTDAIGEERPFMYAEGIGSMPSAGRQLRENQLLEQAGRQQRQQQAMGLLQGREGLSEQGRQADQSVALKRELGLGGQDIQRQQLAQQGELGRSGQDIERQRLAQGLQLGLSEQDIARQQLAQRGELGQRGLDIEQQRTEQTGALGFMQQDYLRDQLRQQGITDERSQDIAIQQLEQQGRLGERGLSLQEREIEQRGGLGLMQQEFLRDELRQRGITDARQQDIAIQQITQEGQLTQRGQDITREIGLGSQQTQRDIASGQQAIGLRQAALGEAELAQRGALGEAELAQRGELGREGIAVQRQQFSQQGELGRANLAIERQRLKQQGDVARLELDYKKTLEAYKPTEFQKTLDRERAKGLVQREKDRREETKNATRMLQQLDILEDLNDVSGFGANQWAGITKAASAVGIGSGEYASRVEAFKSIRSELAGNLTKQLAGPLSEKELKFITQQPPNETNTMDGNQMIIDNLRLITLSKLGGTDADRDLDAIQSGNDVGTRLREAMSNDPDMSAVNIIEVMRETNMSIDEILSAGGY